VKKRGGVLDVLPCCFFDNRIGICGICGINFIGGHFVFLAKFFFRYWSVENQKFKEDQRARTKEPMSFPANQKPTIDFGDLIGRSIDVT